MLMLIMIIKEKYVDVDGNVDDDNNNDSRIADPGPETY